MTDGREPPCATSALPSPPPIGLGLPGPSGRLTFGQTFTPDTTQASLAGFPLFPFGGIALDVRGCLATWDGTRAGGIVCTSETRGIAPGGGLQEFAFAVDLKLTAGQRHGWAPVPGLAPPCRRAAGRGVRGYAHRLACGPDDAGVAGPW